MESQLNFFQVPNGIVCGSIKNATNVQLDFFMFVLSEIAADNWQVRRAYKIPFSMYDLLLIGDDGELDSAKMTKGYNAFKNTLVNQINFNPMQLEVLEKPVLDGRKIILSNCRLDDDKLYFKFDNRIIHNMDNLSVDIVDGEFCISGIENDLRNVDLESCMKEQYKSIPIFQKNCFYKGGSVHVTLTDQFIDYISSYYFDSKNGRINGTFVRLEEYVALSSIYSKRLMLLCRKWYKTGKAYFNYEDLRYKLGIREKATNKEVQNILDKAVEEINNVCKNNMYLLWLNRTNNSRTIKKDCSIAFIVKKVKKENEDEEEEDDE